MIGRREKYTHILSKSHSNPPAAIAASALLILIQLHMPPIHLLILLALHKATPLAQEPMKVPVTKKAERAHPIIEPTDPIANGTDTAEMVFHVSKPL